MVDEVIAQGIQTLTSRPTYTPAGELVMPLSPPKSLLVACPTDKEIQALRRLLRAALADHLTDLEAGHEEREPAPWAREAMGFLPPKDAPPPSDDGTEVPL